MKYFEVWYAQLVRRSNFIYFLALAYFDKLKFSIISALEAHQVSQPSASAGRNQSYMAV